MMCVDVVHILPYYDSASDIGVGIHALIERTPLLGRSIEVQLKLLGLKKPALALAWLSLVVLPACGLLLVMDALFVPLASAIGASVDQIKVREQSCIVYSIS
jgi:hypothetical protein